MNSGRPFSFRFDYNRWANLDVWDALTRFQETAPEKAWSLLAHIAAADLLWQQRIRAEATGEVWPAWHGEELKTRLQATHAQWQSIVQQDLTRRVEYRNSKGEPWSSSVEDILEHVLFHSAYHRGQIAMLLRQAGLEPPYTDYIHAVRQRRF